MQDQMSDRVQNRKSNRMSNKISEYMSARLRCNVEYTSDNISGKMSGRVSEFICNVSAWDKMSNGMSEYVPRRRSQQFCLRVSQWGATCRYYEFTRGTYTIYTTLYNIIYIYNFCASHSVTLLCACGTVYNYVYIYYIYREREYSKWKQQCTFLQQFWAQAVPSNDSPHEYPHGTFGGRYSSFTSMSSPGVPNEWIRGHRWTIDS